MDWSPDQMVQAIWMAVCVHAIASMNMLKGPNDNIQVMPSDSVANFVHDTIDSCINYGDVKTAQHLVPICRKQVSAYADGCKVNQTTTFNETACHQRSCSDQHSYLSPD